MSNDLIKNPFVKENITTPMQSSSALAEQQRAMTEVQAALLIAQTYTRDTVKAIDEILQACTRPTLAEKAIYSYPRGGSEITGPSIRLAEAIAQIWGNIQFGIKELFQGYGKSTVQAFAWDIQKNIRIVKEFEVPHIRFTKRGVTKLEDPTDIYMTIANQGARRVRACILGLIPGDVIDAAVKQCELTLESKIDVSPDNVRNMVGKFKDEFDVTIEMLEKKLGRRIDTINRPQMMQLHKIINSLRDGMSSVATWFELAPNQPTASEAGTGKVSSSIKEKLLARSKAAQSDVPLNLSQEAQDQIVKESIELRSKESQSIDPQSLIDSLEKDKS